MITFQKESWIDLLPELPAIFLAHWEEVALERTVIPLEPDWERYSRMDLEGVSHMLTVRDDGILVGYYHAIVMPHLHYRSSKTAWSDLIYLHPEYRKGLTGYKMLKHAEKMLKDLGVQRSYLMTKAHLPINILMKRLKYRLVERTFTKLL